MSPLDPRALRTAFGSFLTGVTVVTAQDEAGAPLGFTANSFTSVSLDPPLLLVCLANSSANYDALVSAPSFAVNILAETQIDISNTFARPSDDRFAGIEWRAGPSGTPLLDNVSAWFDCTRHQVVEAGDHVILIGAVRDFHATPAPGLGYVRGAYVTPSAAAEALNSSTNLVVSALIERDGSVLMVDDGRGGLTVPQAIVPKGQVPSAALSDLIASLGISAEPGFIYSVFEDTRLGRQHIAFLCNASGGAPRSARFVPLGPHAFDDVSDPAVLTMLERFATEARLGNFGIYYGNQTRGEVRSVV